MNKRVGPTSLDDEFVRIACDHKAATLVMVARGSLPGSIVRVFRRNTKAALLEVLPDIEVEQLTGLEDERAFREWFERQLDPVAEAILRLNPPDRNPRIHPGSLARESA